jgi:hypothetical protein
MSSNLQINPSRRSTRSRKYEFVSAFFQWEVYSVVFGVHDGVLALPSSRSKRARTDDEDVNESFCALLPVRAGSHVGHPDERSQ